MQLTKSSVNKVEDEECPEREHHAEDVKYRPFLPAHEVQEGVREATVDLRAVLDPEGVESAKGGGEEGCAESRCGWVVALFEGEEVWMSAVSPKEPV